MAESRHIPRPLSDEALRLLTSLPMEEIERRLSGPALNEGRESGAVTAKAGNRDVSQLSDGYHTFAELYKHRHSLVLALMRALHHISWFSRRHATGELPFGSEDWFIIGIELPGNAITYHLPISLYPLAQKTKAAELLTGKYWDGHTAAEVVRRLRAWAIASPSLAGKEPAAVEGQPSDEELDELAWNWFSKTGSTWYQVSAFRAFARAVLARWGSQQPLRPIPVSERLPGPEDCDLLGYCWWGDAGGGEFVPSWRLCERPSDSHFTHWLPANALPLPEVE